MKELSIKVLVEKKLVGFKKTMSLTFNKTPELWKSFMPRRKEIQNSIGIHLYSINVYDPVYFTPFDAGKEFEKWATVEVENFDKVPDVMESFRLDGGLYAVFHYKGLSTDTRVFHFIFSEWLPNSGYTLDQRPHFQVLGEKYKNNYPNSEEEIWIPVKAKDLLKS